MASYVLIDTNTEVKNLVKAQQFTKKKLRGDRFQTLEWGKIDSFEMISQTLLINGAGLVVHRV